MSQLNRDSLGLTLDSVAESLFFGNPMPEPRRIAAAKWIAGRQGLPGSYADMFAPTVQDTLADLKTLRAWRRQVAPLSVLLHLPRTHGNRAWPRQCGDAIRGPRIGRGTSRGSRWPKATFQSAGPRWVKGCSMCEM